MGRTDNGNYKALVEWQKENKPWNYSEVGKGLICQHCGGEFDTNPHKVRDGKAKYCSLDCYNDARRNPNRPKQLKQRFTPEYKEWKRAVLERDNFTCQDCGLTATEGANLAAHHIKPFVDFPHLRTAMSNGITLCRNCHHRAHYGYDFGYGECIDCGERCAQSADRCRDCDNEYRRQTDAAEKKRRNAIARAYREGNSLRAVGEMFGINHKSVLYLLKNMGVERRPRSKGKRVNND